MLSGQEVRRIRTAKGLSQQQLAFKANVNKAYISEYESGVRAALPERMQASLEAALLEPAPAGFTRPSIVTQAGKSRLKLIDPEGNVYYPDNASVQWTEADGAVYSIFLGER